MSVLHALMTALRGIDAVFPCRMRVGLPRASVLERFASKEGLAADRQEAASLKEAMEDQDSFLTGARVPDIRIRSDVADPNQGMSKHTANASL